MTTCFLVQTDKAYKVQEKGVYILAFANKGFKINKIELGKLLKSEGISPLNITFASSYQKKKKRGKKGNIVTQFRPSKYFVRLNPSQSIDENIINAINTKLNPVK